jgi:hypothetical protein
LLQQQQQQQQQQLAAQAAMSLAENSLSAVSSSGGAGGRGLSDDITAGLSGLMNRSFLPPGSLAGSLGSNFTDANNFLLRQLLSSHIDTQSAAAALLQEQKNQQQQQQQQFEAGALAGYGMTSAFGRTSDPYAERGILGPWSATSAGILDKFAQLDRERQAHLENSTRKKKIIRRKPKDKPKRPLSAYNIFFKEERARILTENAAMEKEQNADGGGRMRGKIGFENLAKSIGQRWQQLDKKLSKYYKAKAEEDMARYRKEMEIYNAKHGAKKKGDDIDDNEEDEKEGAHAQEEEKETAKKKEETSATVKEEEEGTSATVKEEEEGTNPTEQEKNEDEPESKRARHNDY